MAEGRARDDWARLSWLMWAVLTAGGRAKKGLKLDAFDPYAREPEESPAADDLVLSKDGVFDLLTKVLVENYRA